jgi:hypothetical protein
MNYLYVVLTMKTAFPLQMLARTLLKMKWFCLLENPSHTRAPLVFDKSLGATICEKEEK